jgi:hypothetical protein
VQVDQRVAQALQVRRAIREIRVNLDLLDRVVQVAAREQVDKQDRLVLAETMEIQVLRVLLDQRDLQDLQDQVDKLVQLVRQE